MAVTIGQMTNISSTTATQIVTASTPVTYGVHIQGLTANAGKAVYVGVTSAVTAAVGYEVVPLKEIFISKAEAPDASGIWVIASTTTLGLGYRIV